VFYEAIFGKERGVQHIVIEGDAKQITDAIHEKGRSFNRIGHLVDDVKLCLNDFPKWQVNHVYRVANKGANGLAKMTLQQFNDSVQVEECPPCIRDTLLSELLPCQ
jgi:hypothetical protein